MWGDMNTLPHQELSLRLLSNPQEALLVSSDNLSKFIEISCVSDTSVSRLEPCQVKAIGLNSGCCTVVENNRLSNSALPSSGRSIGIEVVPQGAFDVLVVNNRITTMTEGISAAGGIKLRDNLTTGVTTPFSGGVAGNNN
jgi:hypothetical protein